MEKITVSIPHCQALTRVHARDDLAKRLFICQGIESENTHTYIYIYIYCMCAHVCVCIYIYIYIYGCVSGGVEKLPCLSFAEPGALPGCRIGSRNRIRLKICIFSGMSVTGTARSTSHFSPWRSRLVERSRQPRWFPCLKNILTPIVLSSTIQSFLYNVIVQVQHSPTLA